MKKLFLSLIIGIFLISLASATVTVSTNSTRPVFYLTLTPDNGTNQLADNTNYYFQCFIGGYGYDGASYGPASEEFNITTNSTHRWINLSNIQPMCNSYTINTGYKGVHCRVSANRSFKDWGGSGYLPATFTSNESLNTKMTWTEKLGNPGGYWGPNLRCNRGEDVQTIDSSILYYGNNGNYVFHPEISIPLSERNRLNASFNIYKGTADVYINGDSTWNDLINAFIDSGNGDLASLSGDSITFMGQIYGTGAMTLSGKTINIIGGDSDDSNINFTDASTLNIDRDQGGSWYSAMGKFHDSFLFANAGGVILNSLTEVSNLAYTVLGGSSTHYSSSDGWTYNSKTANAQHQTRYTNNFTVSNSVWNRMYEYDVYSANDNDYKTTTYINDTINDVTLAYDLYFYNGYDTTNCNLTEETILINTVTNQPDKRVRVAYSSDATAGVNCGSKYLVNAYFDVNIKVVDGRGNPISNANVSFTGETTNSTLTNSDGFASLRLKSYGYNFNWSAYNHANFHDYGDYILTIAKTGYKTYNTSVYIDDEKNWLVALFPSNVVCTPLNTTHLQVGSSLKLNYIPSFILPLVYNLEKVPFEFIDILSLNVRRLL